MKFDAAAVDIFSHDFNRYNVVCDRTSFVANIDKANRCPVCVDGNDRFTFDGNFPSDQPFSIDLALDYLGFFEATVNRHVARIQPDIFAANALASADKEFWLFR
jgi:hypothetical protein